MSFSPRRRAISLIVVGVAIAVYFVLAPRWPKDQVVHVVLGDAAPRVQEVRVRYASAAESRGGQAEDWTREASFRYALNSAPRVLTHEPRLPDGDYVVEIDLVSPSTPVTVRRRVALQGGTTSIDVSRELPAAAPTQGASR